VQYSILLVAEYVTMIRYEPVLKIYDPYDAQYFVNGSQMSKSTSRNGEYEYDETDSSYDVDLKVKLPPSSSMKQGNH
jgi:hypothetical protein